jgi:hypothetical protein
MTIEESPAVDGADDKSLDVLGNFRAAEAFSPRRTLSDGLGILAEEPGKVGKVLDRVNDRAIGARSMQGASGTVLERSTVQDTTPSLQEAKLLAVVSNSAMSSKGFKRTSSAITLLYR